MMFFLLEYGSGFGYCLIMKAERLSEVISDVEYMYDSSGRRTCSVRSQSGTTRTNYYIYDGIQCVADTDSSGNLLRSYTWGPGVDTLLAMTVYTGSVVRTYYALTDHLGTVHALADSSGNIVESYKYDAWGRVLSIEDNTGNQLSESALGNRYLWQGREYSWSANLYYFRARFYDPVTGRWLSKDPIGISGGLNQYVFVENNPVNYTDPFGLCADDGYLHSAAYGTATYLGKKDISKTFMGTKAGQALADKLLEKFAGLGVFQRREWGAWIGKSNNSYIHGPLVTSGHPTKVRLSLAGFNRLFATGSGNIPTGHIHIHTREVPPSPMDASNIAWMNQIVLKANPKATDFYVVTPRRRFYQVVPGRGYYHLIKQ